MKYDVAAIGELLIDFTAEKIDQEGYPTMTAHPGGAPANFLASMAKYGASTAMIGKVGDDAFGHMLIDTLKKAKINTDALIADPNFFTSLAFVTLNKGGERSFSFARKPGADTGLTAEEIKWSIIDDSAILHFGTLSLTDEPSKSATERAVEYARHKNKLISFDPNLRPPLWKSLDQAREAIAWGLRQADLVKLSDTEAHFLFGELEYNRVVDKLINEYEVKLVFLTLGSEGCIAANAGNRCKLSAMPGIKPVDTTGAGDIFGGSAMWQIINDGVPPEKLTGSDLKNICKFACAAAGLSTLSYGGISSIPDIEKVIGARDQAEWAVI